MNQPLVSVIMPVYNGLPHLREAVASILAQTYEAIELVVVDDGSTDGSGDVVRELAPGATLIKQDNGGIGAARNRAMREARGDYFAFLDADDVALPSRIQHQLAVLLESAADAAFCHVVEFRTREDGSRSVTPAIPALIPSGCLVSRRAALAIGPFCTDLRVGEFVDWWARAEELGLRHVTVPATLVERRLHAANTGRRDFAHRADFLKVIRAARERRSQS